MHGDGVELALRFLKPVFQQEPMNKVHLDFGIANGFARRDCPPHPGLAGPQMPPGNSHQHGQGKECRVVRAKPCFKLAPREKLGSRNLCRVADDDPIDRITEAHDGPHDVFHVGYFVDGKYQNGQSRVARLGEFRELDLLDGSENGLVHVRRRINDCNLGLGDFAQDLDYVALGFRVLRNEGDFVRVITAQGAVEAVEVIAPPVDPRSVIQWQRAMASVDLPRLPRVWMGTMSRCLISRVSAVGDVGSLVLFMFRIGGVFFKKDVGEFLHFGM